MTAVDDDLEGTIVYTLEGEFPVQSFIDLDQFSGVVTLRNSLLSDSTQNTIYTVCIVTSYFDMLLRINTNNLPPIPYKILTNSDFVLIETITFKEIVYVYILTI